jgi:hypothetical protein
MVPSRYVHNVADCHGGHIRRERPKISRFLAIEWIHPDLHVYRRSQFSSKHQKTRITDPINPANPEEQGDFLDATRCDCGGMGSADGNETIETPNHYLGGTR